MLRPCDGGGRLPKGAGDFAAAAARSRRPPNSGDGENRRARRRRPELELAFGGTFLPQEASVERNRRFDPFADAGSPERGGSRALGSEHAREDCVR
jgi:hypothetical protein